MNPRRILLFILLALTIGAFGFNWILFNRANGYYSELNRVHLDPLGLSFYPTNQITFTTTEKIAVFFGDSRAYAWTAPSVSGFQFINRGIGNQTSAQVSARFNAHITPLHPQIVIVQVGINDLKTIPLFPEQKQEIIANCKSNIKQISDDARKLKAKVILTTIFPLGKIPVERRLFWSDDVALAINDVNTFIRSLADKDTIVFDTGEILVNENGLVRPEYQSDFLHINSTGYQSLNVKLARVLNELQ